MCGRYANFLSEQALVDHFHLARVADEPRLLDPNWNVSPTQQVAIIVPGKPDDPGRRLEAAHWGLVPSWAKDPSIGSRMINARSETAAEKPSFRSAFAKRRCLVPASGYYEWQTGADGKQPFYIHAVDDAPLAFAGLYEFWRDKSLGDDAPWLVTTTIMTTAARGDMRDIHDRQPVMLGADAVETWLDRDAAQGTLFDVIAMPAPEVEWHAVHKAVGSPRNNGPENVEHRS
ncbi:SOS response-associated peptidase [Demequina sediminicola]|uniref:SOS response-associated peptidase n=1 Tax=Demequina sediminicola TaxID=1095026 RepID=UPI000784C787|nr:SOS response-associated peptidase [Demequina sediminicola]